jgi:hypothetical protein
VGSVRAAVSRSVEDENYQQLLRAAQQQLLVLFFSFYHVQGVVAWCFCVYTCHLICLPFVCFLFFSQTSNAALEAHVSDQLRLIDAQVSRKEQQLAIVEQLMRVQRLAVVVFVHFMRMPLYRVAFCTMFELNVWVVRRGTMRC